MQIIDGSEISRLLLEDSGETLRELGLAPKLAIVFIGENIESSIYIKKKQEAGAKVGVKVELHSFLTASDLEVQELIKKLALDPETHGIIIQLPAPGIDWQAAAALIPPQKDVDGMNPLSLGLIWQRRGYLVPATAKAVILALEHIAKLESKSLLSFIEAKNVLIINRTVIIGQPLLAILSNLNGTVTVAHSHTRDLEGLMRNADIVISGAGVPGLIDAEHLKSGAIVIDAGFKKTEKGTRGDVGDNDLSALASWLSPVPGGIGPLGVACLINNTVIAADLQKNGLEAAKRNQF